MILPRMTKLVIVPVMLLVLLFILDWVSALIGLLVFPAIILQMVLIGHTASLEAGKQHKEYQRLANHFLDSIQQRPNRKNLPIKRTFSYRNNKDPSRCYPIWCSS